MANINRVVLVGNLTRDPELRHTPSGTAVCKLRIAVNTRQKDAQGNWGDKPNYFDVTVWGNQGESCAQFLSKGRPVGVDGRLDWREWDAQDGTKRQEVDYKNYNQLRRYVSEKGKIRSRRITGACRRHQRQVAVAVKRAREMALLPYVAEGREDREGGGRRDRDRDRDR